MLKRTVLTTLAGAAVAAGLAAGAAPAQAALGECPANRVCLWFNSDYAGARADFKITDGSMADDLFNDGPAGRNGWLVQVEDNAASVANRSGEGIILFNRRNCNDADGAVILPPGSEYNLATFGLKNRVSSVYVANGPNAACANVDSSPF